MALNVAIGNRKILTNKLEKKVPFLHWKQAPVIENQEHWYLSSSSDMNFEIKVYTDKNNKNFI
jgi:hypothetical protein